MWSHLLVGVDIKIRHNRPRVMHFVQKCTSSTEDSHPLCALRGLRMSWSARCSATRIAIWPLLRFCFLPSFFFFFFLPLLFSSLFVETRDGPNAILQVLLNFTRRRTAAASVSHTDCDENSPFDQTAMWLRPF